MDRCPPSQALHHRPNLHCPGADVKLSTLLCAEYASVRDGVLFVIAGGVNEFAAEAYPTEVPFFLGIIVEARAQRSQCRARTGYRPATGPRTAYFATMSLLFENVPRDDADPREPTRAVFALQLSHLVLPDPGEYEFTAAIDGTELGRLWMAARQGLPEGP